jgi:hypothetical protein
VGNSDRRQRGEQEAKPAPYAQSLASGVVVRAGERARSGSHALGGNRMTRDRAIYKVAPHRPPTLETDEGPGARARPTGDAAPRSRRPCRRYWARVEAREERVERPTRTGSSTSGPSPHTDIVAGHSGNPQLAPHTLAGCSAGQTVVLNLDLTVDISSVVVDSARPPGAWQALPARYHHVWCTTASGSARDDRSCSEGSLP